MKQDVLDWSNGSGRKRISKETLNHRGLIEMVSGMDSYQQTPEAYRRAYESLGIDVINRVPLENASLPTPQGTVRRHPEKPYDISALGVYDTVCRREYPCRSEEDVGALDMDGVSYADQTLHRAATLVVPENNDRRGDLRMGRAGCRRQSRHGEDCRGGNEHLHHRQGSHED